MSTAMVAKYGAEALEHLREAQLMLQVVSAMGQLEKRPWAGLASEWERTLTQLIGQIEDVDLRGESEHSGVYPLLPLPDRLEGYARAQVTVFLRVQRKNGTVETVEYEPYSIHQSLKDGQPYLVCYHLLHDHIERLALRNIVGIVGEGTSFEPRWDVEGKE